MPESEPPTWVLVFDDVPDPRIDRCKRHELTDILVIAVVASLCGADDFVSISEFGQSEESWFRKYLALPNGIPSHDTFNRVFKYVDPAAFDEAIRRFLVTVFGAQPDRQIAVDGKTSRAAGDAGSDHLHTVSAYSIGNGLVLGQVRTARKSNEITAIPQLLALLDLKGTVVTTDAMGCQRDIAEMVVAKGGDYVLAVKDNQPTLHVELQHAIEAAASADVPVDGWTAAETEDTSHGRVASRLVCTISNLASLPIASSWPRARSVGMIEVERTVQGVTRVERRCYISSRQLTARQLAGFARAHWHVENSHHWVLDVVFNDDRSRARKGNAAINPPAT